MKTKWFLVPVLSGCFLYLIADGFAETESLAEAARREAERRSEVERLGIHETVVEGNDEGKAMEGNLSIFTPSATKSSKRPASVSSPKSSGSLSRYRAQLKKLDREIRKKEGQVEKLRDQAQDLRRKNLMLRDLSKIARNDQSRAQTQEQIRALEDELKILRRERMEVFDSGKRDGFLPGELDGKGIVP
jgi:chromosome segregation ATPase